MKDRSLYSRLRHPKNKPASARQRLGLALLVVTTLGFASKYGYSNHILNDYVAGIWYVVFWILFWVWIFPGEEKLPLIATGVFLTTAFLEVLQLYNPPLLAWLRSFWLGKVLLGTSFVWWDFPCYLLGALIGYWLARSILQT